MSVGARINLARKSAKMSQQDLELRTNISQGRISLFESGQKRPTLENVKAIAEVLNVSADFILGVERDPNNQVHGLGQLSGEDTRLVVQLVRRLLRYPTQ